MIRTLTFLLLLFVASANAATLYCGPSNTGSGSGADFSNLLQLPTTTGFTRGDTYVVVDGSYGSRTFSEPASGTTRITVRKADASDSGVTGYASTLHDGQATFGALNVTTTHWTIDGGSGGGPGNFDGPFGFEFNGSSSIGVVGFPPATQTDSVIIRHCEIDGEQTVNSEVRTLTISGADDLTIEYCWIRRSGCDMISGNYMNRFTVQYSRIEDMYGGACHGDVFEYQIQDAEDFVFRWNWIEDVIGTYCFGAHGTPVSIDRYYVYGNIFRASDSRALFFGNGTMGTIGDGQITNAKFLHNTIVGEIEVDSGTIGISGNVTGEVRNNIWWRATGTGFNIGLGGTSSGNTTYNGGATGAQEELTGDPFVNAGSLDFGLATNSTTGTTLSAPFDEDMFGNAYNADGTWDRGALAFGSGGAPDPEITIAATDATATEAGTTTGTFTITASASFTGTVNYSIAGTATNGSDYSTLSGTVSMSGTSVTITITPIDDESVESDETVILTLETGSGYTVGTPSSDTVTITSDDSAPVFVQAPTGLRWRGGR